MTAILDTPATGAEKAGQALYITASFTRLEISVVDQKPEEVLSAAFVGLKLESASGIGQDGSFSSLRFQLSSIQLDDQLPNSRQGFTPKKSAKEVTVVQALTWWSLIMMIRLASSPDQMASR